ncbi:hypothetical protein ACF1AL_19625 [Streptomyces sp. NPDC014801]|uniref:hypothetical protein n=1 Tax=Streptomyces sp. NPDC014801 TaxID=3364916 RepID=UPI0036F973D5
MDAPRRNLSPPPALFGFLLLLVAVFAVSYAVGAAVGPVSPGLHGGPAGHSRPGDGDADDMGGMHGMHGGGR